MFVVFPSFARLPWHGPNRIGREPTSACAFVLAMTALWAAWTLPAAAAQPTTANTAANIATVLASLPVRPDRLLILDAVQVEKRIVAVGEKGFILISDDDGASWKIARSPLGKTLTAVTFRSAKQGWAVGHGGTVLRTEDGGSSWNATKVSAPRAESLLDVWFGSDTKGFAVGAYGSFLETSDGGQNWQPRNILPADVDFHLNAIASGAGGKLFIAGEKGILLRSLDGGNNWEKLTSPYEGSFFGILPLADGAVLVYGMRGNVYRTDDAGSTWSRVDVDTKASFAGATALADGTVVLVGNEGAIAISKDKGRHFSLRQTLERRALAAVLPVGDRLMTFGETGLSWQHLEFPR